MVKLGRSFRTKMILYLSLSMFLSATITFVLYKLLQLYYTTQVRLENPLTPIRYFMRELGDIYFFLLIFIPLSILFFFMFTRRYVAYFQEISKGIHYLANGDFNSRINLVSRDEFGDIAKDMNLASEKLQQAVEKGAFAESSKDQLVLNLAHDLRTPLTSVLGYLDFILKDDQLTAVQVQHYATIAYTKSQRLEKLVDELFEITRMSYGMSEVEHHPIDLSELLMQLHEELYPMLEKSQLIARLDVRPHLNITGDGELLARVFENLLMNAIRYGADGQFIDICADRMEGEVVVQVINYGNFIPPEQLPHLFDMFYIGDKARSHQGESTGLGLFIAKNIVTQHQGIITAQSSLIRTVFEVRLPQASEILESPLKQTHP
ncbi:HAMP domain-containing sensor histidine kinase [Paenibacillus sp. UMB4589-SE434]|uniref:sensor histidine kinase n=1 Tax=Paenibacillus sp. UMB4589-SE434 TaxID=3046314 RepID=UPI00254D0EE8|nr:HAMP domain-containing sensor histidine kinase [Paenibacillus sp. UMB4589-SE434]MDK8179801.1 HAMP domain-containing sensor histidine kinase [Paenibacillus sp. UMB4589-SE434]